MLAVVRWLMAHDDSITEELALRAMLEADAQVRSLWCEREVRIRKTIDGNVGRQGTPPEVQAKAFADALTNKPTSEILRDHGISRATLYRLVKKGPPTT
jgi:hypothetical protein